MLPSSVVAPLVLMALLQTATPAGMRTIDQGTISSVSTPKQEVVRTPEAFSTLWTSHQRRRVVPRVDFEKEMVVALFQGSQPSRFSSAFRILAIARCPRSFGCSPSGK